MEFFNKLGKKASEAYKVTADKTGKLAKEAKLRMKMGELKSEINNIYQEIGKKVYENHTVEPKQDITTELEEQCTKIDCLSDEIESILKECLELKDKKQCPKCFTEIEKDVQFCPKCGTKQEEQKEDNKEVNEENNKEDKEDKDDEQKETSEEKTNLEKTVEVESDVKEEDD